MAVIRLAGTGVVVHLASWEKLLAMHGDISFPAAAIAEVTVVRRPFTGIRGVRSPGTGFPRIVAYGTYRHRDGKDLVLIHLGQPAVRLVLVDQEFSAVLLGARRPDALVDALSGGNQPFRTDTQ